jgi:hypothetical protein
LGKDSNITILAVFGNISRYFPIEVSFIAICLILGGYLWLYVVIHPRVSTLTCNPNGPATRPRSYAPSRATPWFWQMIWSKPPVVWERLAETVGGDGWMCIILLVLSREFSGMIHWPTINFMIPATPIAIHSLRLAPVSHDESLGFTLSSTDSRDNIISKSIGGVS